VIKAANALGLRARDSTHNHISKHLIRDMLQFNDFSVTAEGQRMLIPRRVPVIARFFNSHACNVPVLRKLCMVQYIAARYDGSRQKKRSLSCSVIIPCYNEEGNIRSAIERVPAMGRSTEIVVVDDGSKDKTVEIVKDVMRKNRHVKLVTYEGNRGKGYAVRQGFEKATGDVLMILDADMTVPPEELTRFFSLLEEGKGEFINGTRMIYPMEEQAMKGLHVIGNYFFGKIFSWLLGRRISDTLCGTKVLLRKDYEKIEMGKCKWGDFDLLFGAAKLELRIVEVPVHYMKRVAGESKMKTWKHGFVLLKMCFRGFKELKLKRRAANPRNQNAC
jgi:glycosyltransferase involved in cell wall biosynthesis